MPEEEKKQPCQEDLADTVTHVYGNLRHLDANVAYTHELIKSLGDLVTITLILLAFLLVLIIRQHGS